MAQKKQTLPEGISIINNAIFLAKQKALIIADIHLGYEEHLINTGAFIPKTLLNKTKEEIIALKKVTNANTLIINGDIKHEFKKLEFRAWKELDSFLKFIAYKFKTIILIKGNHDNFILSSAHKLNIQVKDYMVINSIFICHGNKLISEMPKIKNNKPLLKNKKIKTIIIAHEHPAITLRDEIKSERFKCFLIGKYKRKALIVMPAFSMQMLGPDILKPLFRPISPFISQRSLKNFNVLIPHEKEIFDFGKLKSLIHNRQ